MYSFFPEIYVTKNSFFFRVFFFFSFSKFIYQAQVVLSEGTLYDSY